MIASENFPSRAVQDCLPRQQVQRGLYLYYVYLLFLYTNWYYGRGTMARSSAGAKSAAFQQAEGWGVRRVGVNVQPYSGSPAYFAVFTCKLWDWTSRTAAT